jgi:hypothetical protein
MAVYLLDLVEEVEVGFTTTPIILTPHCGLLHTEILVLRVAPELCINLTITCQRFAS